jgi:uncharacterized protein with HEPN domain
LSFRDANLALRHISDSITLIEEFTSGMDFDAFRANPMATAAVERKLLIISEAAVRLGDQASVLCPGIPWHKIRGIGNHLRHTYDRVDIVSVWNTVTDDLPLLKVAVLRALAVPPGPPPAPSLG